MSTVSCGMRIGGKAGRRFVVILSQILITLPLSMVDMRVARRTVRIARTRRLAEQRCPWGMGSRRVGHQKRDTVATFTRRTDLQTTKM